MVLTFYGFRSLKGKNSSFVADSSPTCLDLLVYLIASGEDFTYSSIVVNTSIRPKSPPNDGILPFVKIDKKYVSETKVILQEIGNSLDSNLNDSQLNTTHLVKSLIETSCIWTIGFDWRWGNLQTCKKITAPFYLDGLEISEFLQEKAILDARDEQINRLENSNAGLTLPMVEERIKKGYMDLFSIENIIANEGGFFFDGKQPTSIDCTLYGMTANAIFTAKNYPISRTDDPLQLLLDGKFPKILAHYHFMEKKYGKKLKQVVFDPNEVHSSVKILTSKKKSSTHRPGFFTDRKGNLKFVNFVVKFPLTVFCTILVAIFALTYLLFILVLQKGNPFTDPTQPSYDINDARSVALDSFRLVSEDVQTKRVASMLRRLQDTSTEGVPFQFNYEDVVYWAYESETPEGLFASKESIASMFETLTLFTSNEDYETYCLKSYDIDPINGKCWTPATALYMYYASEWDAELAQSIIDQLKVPENVLRYNSLGVCIEFGMFCDFIPPRYDNDEDKAWAIRFNQNITKIISTWDGTGELNDDLNQVTEFAAYLKNLSTKKGYTDFGFDENFSTNNQKSLYSRSFILFGTPLDRSKLKDIDLVDIDGNTKTDREIFKSWVAKTFLDDMEKFAEVDHDPNLNSYYFMETIVTDVLLRVVIRDALLALFSFAFVFFYIRVMVGSWFLAFVGMTQIFFSIPISWLLYSQVFRIKYFSFLNALCLFIVAAIGADDIFIFMDAYKQSALQDSHILKSFESRMSWVYRRTGSAMAITSATTCAAFLCTLLTPLAAVQAFGIFAALVIFIDYVLVMSLYCTGVIIYHNKFEKDGCCLAPTCFYGGFCKTSDPSPTRKALDKIISLQGSTPEGDNISVFFRSKVTAFLMNTLNRFILISLFVGWVACAAYFGLKIEPVNETEQFLNEDHPLQKSFTILGGKFPKTQNDQGSLIYFAWGVGEVDREGVNRLLDPDFVGKPDYVESFDFNEQCQMEMLNACNDFKTNFAGHVKQEDGIGKVKCFVEELAAYSVYGNLNDCDAVRQRLWMNESWQISSSDVDNLMEGFLAETSCYGLFNDDVATWYENDIGWDGSTLKYAAISMESEVVDPFSTIPEQIARKEYDVFIGKGKELDQVMVEACGSKVVMTDLDNHFVFMNTQRIYVRTAIQSAGLGIGIAFTVLLIATRALHLAFFATFSILCVLASILGSMYLLGWSLGSIEAILITITAGFAVDYVVHLAHAYERAAGDTYTRMSTAFGEMGISVFSGMVTSVGASISLFFCQLQFFKKFGTFICLTIGFSWIFANFFFMSIIGQAKIRINNKKTCLRL